MLRAWIVAASSAIRDELRAALSPPAADIIVAGESASVRQIDLAAGLSADVFVLDDATTTGLNFALASAGSQAVVLLSDQPGRAAELRAMRLRGWALLPADASAEALRAACAAAHAGLCATVPDDADELLVGARTAETPLDQPLTARERDVLELAGRGLPSKLIAAELGVTESTVKFHLSSIFAKLSASSRTEAVSKAARLGLITL